MTDQKDNDYLSEEEVSHDDAVIGRALRRSAWILAALVAAVAIVLLVSRIRHRGAEVKAIEVSAPRVTDSVIEPPSLEFTDITSAAGVEFVHENGARGERFLPETMGSGVAFFDADRDGDPDLLLIDGTVWSAGDRRPGKVLGVRYYENDGTGHFSDRSRQRGLDQDFYGTGVAVGDFDNDGFSDLFLAALGANRLLRNVAAEDGSRRFVDVTGRAGVAGAQDAWSTGAAFFDGDGDGDLDLFVGNYVQWSKEIDRAVDYRLTGVGRAYGPPVNYRGTFSSYFRNDGDGRFTDFSAEAGVQVKNAATGEPAGKVLGVAPIDADGDGAMDLFVANDTVRNFLFHNRGDGHFEEVGELWGVAYGRDGTATGAMGVDAGYFRNDADLGLAIGNFANEMSSLFVTQGDAGLYADEAISAGIGAASRRSLSFGMLFVDLDLDGWLDLVQSNGHLENEINAVDPSQQYRQPTQVFWNAGGAGAPRLVEVPSEKLGALAQPLVGRASATADIDGDGDLDLVVTQTGDRAVLYRNEIMGRHWLRVRLIGDGVTVNHDAIGARLELRSRAASGATGSPAAASLVQRRQIMPTRSFQAQSELVATFGLGAATAVEGLTVIWPNGSSQEVTVEEVDRLLEVRFAP